jgi:hypothetical protein
MMKRLSEPFCFSYYCDRSRSCTLTNSLNPQPSTKQAQEKKFAKSLNELHMKNLVLFLFLMIWLPHPHLAFFAMNVRNSIPFRLGMGWDGNGNPCNSCNVVLLVKVLVLGIPYLCVDIRPYLVHQINLNRKRYN